MAEKLVLIDGHSIINRAFYGVPDLTNSAGLHTNAVYGFLNILFKLLDEERPDYLVVAFDEHAPTFRHEMYKEYKGTRKPMADELREQVPVLRQLLEAMKVMCVSRAGLEADDILGTLAKKSSAAGIDVRLVSGDRDLLQIADDRICVRIPRTKGGKTTIDDFYAADVEAAYHVTPKQFVELKALMGDSSDNIPGVPKVGEKTATDLMIQYGSINGIYEHLEEITKNAVRESLRENRDLCDLCLKLATIKTDCDVELDKERAKAEGFFTPEAYDIIKRLEFKKFFDRFEISDNPQTVRTDTKTDIKVFDDIDAFADFTAPAPVLGLRVIGDGAGAVCASAAYLDGDTERVAYIQGPDKDYRKLCNLISEKTSADSCIATFDIKSEYDHFGRNYEGRAFDILLAAYLLDPLKNDHDECSIAQNILDKNIPARQELLGKSDIQGAFFSLPDKLKEYACNSAQVCLECYEPLKKRLEKNGMYDLLRDMEMPLSYVIWDIERIGVRADKSDIVAFGNSLSGRISELEKSIYTGAGCEFNINSPKQLGEILFEKMGLQGGKKTKTGYSTAADVLEKLAEDTPVVKDILEYRTLTKLKSTYADALPDYIAADGRIHTTFSQTTTATGRLSSSEPNLQNIPIRTEIGKQLRKVFVADEGCVFIDADYSQIELRVLASLSGDEELIDSYRSEKDIHRITASKVFKVPFEEVTDVQRRNAKAVNFGIVYGISSFGLSQDLSISKKEAAEYIEKYFETYPGIKGYLDGLIKDAKDKGYSETYYGRRRPIPELKSSNFMQRSFGERVAMNAPIQGTAADIIKRAMISVWREIDERGLKGRLILQVHDELLIECPESEKDIMTELLERNMKAAADLKVELSVGIESGHNWLEAH